MRRVSYVVAMLLAVASAGNGIAQERSADQAAVVVSGDLRQWHKVTLTLDGPDVSETSQDPNPFLDYRMTVTFTHESGMPVYHLPGYFAGDGNAAGSSASSGNKWRAHFSPDKIGRWDWRIGFVSGRHVAVDAAAAANGRTVAPYDGRSGTLRVIASNKTAPDFRARGRLSYVGHRYLRFAGSGEYFLKAGPDSPETLLAYSDFDDTIATKPAGPLKTYADHVRDWTAGDPVWQDGKGRGLIGAINYLAAKRMNTISFLTYNAGGDGDNVWPFVSRDDKLHYDVSKLDQWQIVFDHAQRKGLHLHFKLQETENDDHTRGNPVAGPGRGGRGAPGRGGPPAGGGRGAGRGPAGQSDPVVESLDDGDLGVERKLYLREIVARFGYLLALNWNLGEENTQTTDQQRAMAAYLRSLDPYQHHIVIHTYPNAHEAVYLPLVGDQSMLTGASLQNAYNASHERTARWIAATEQTGRPWVVANDEQGPSTLGVPPDPGFNGFAGKDAQGNDVPYGLHDVRKYTLWGTLMAGGGGVEYYFGYQLPQNDLVAEDFRSRDQSWDFARIALTFFSAQRIPYWAMRNADALVGNASHDNSKYAFAKAGDIYLVYLPTGGTTMLDLSDASGPFAVRWFDPRRGGALRSGSVAAVRGGGSVSLGQPPDNPGEDWLVVVRR